MFVSQEEYEKLKQSIEDATQKEAVFGFDLKGDMAVFSNTNRLNHPPIVKVTHCPTFLRLFPTLIF